MASNGSPQPASSSGGGRRRLGRPDLVETVQLASVIAVTAPATQSRMIATISQSLLERILWSSGLSTLVAPPGTGSSSGSPPSPSPRLARPCGDRSAGERDRGDGSREAEHEDDRNDQPALARADLVV